MPKRLKEQLKEIAVAAIDFTELALDVGYGQLKKLFRLIQRQDPPLMLHEINSDYVASLDPDWRARFIVSLIVAYDDEIQQVQNPGEAAEAALDFIRNASGTTWYVYDRKTHEMHSFQEAYSYQKEFIRRGVAPTRDVAAADFAAGGVTDLRRVWELSVASPGSPGSGGLAAISTELVELVTTESEEVDERYRKADGLGLEADE